MPGFQQTGGFKPHAAANASAILALALFGPFAITACAQKKTVSNLDESKVGAYTLPDPLVAADGRKVTTTTQWIRERRPELLHLFEAHVYGEVPEHQNPIQTTFQVTSEDQHALSGTAIRREVSILLSEKPGGPRIDLLLYLPKKAGGSTRVPAFLGMNFRGNHTIQPDPGIALSRQWMRENGEGVVNNQATESSRGTDSSSWPVERIIARGYALATFYYGDVDPDYDDGFKNGIHPLFYRHGQVRPDDDEWGSIAAWSWGLSRALDCLETMPQIDAHKVVLMGHSRLGKAVLWAGAADPRFAIVVSVQSGCGGAALSRRIFGETVEQINTSFPHWFCTNFRQYNNHENKLPVDQHELIALIAPRPILVCSAQDDLHADPKGEFLAALGADPVYRLLGTDGLAATEMPKAAPNQLIKSTIGYHIRPGKHQVASDDWDTMMDFADHHLKRQSK
jgi:hypothetical protein